MIDPQLLILESLVDHAVVDRSLPGIVVVDRLIAVVVQRGRRKGEVLVTRRQIDLRLHGGVLPDVALRPVVYLRRIAALSEQHEADLILLNLPMFGDPSLSEPYRDLLRSLGRLIEFESLETLYDNRNWNEVMHLDRRGRDIFTRHFLEVYQDQDRGSLPRSPR